VHVYWNSPWKPSGALAGLLIYKNSSFENHRDEGVGVKSVRFIDGTQVFYPGNVRFPSAVAQSHTKYSYFIERVRGMRNTSVMASDKDSGDSKKRGSISLAQKHPELAREAFGWDPELVPFGSKKKLKWKCPKNHVFEATVSNRAHAGTKCPFCANVLVLAGFNDLATTNPDLAKQAHGWDPKTVIAGSKKKLPWRCDKGHVWEASLDGRSGQNRGCPYCSNSKVLAGFNDLATTNPDLAKQAHGWDPTTVIAGSARKMIWICHFQHTWTAALYTRTGKQNQGCPYCSGKRILSGFNDLKTTHPHIAKEAVGWDATKFSKGSGGAKKWCCQFNHQWEATIGSRVRGRGCPICSGAKVQKGFNDLATTHPNLSREAYGWDPTTISRGSPSKREWKCNQGHLWEASVGARAGLNSGCPYCSGLRIIVGETDLASTHPHLAKEANGWDPRTVSRGSIKSLSWLCKQGHVFQSAPNSRTSDNQNCPVCSGHKVLAGFNDLLTVEPEVASQAFGWDPSTVTKGHGGRKEWRCELGHVYSAPVSQRTNNRTGCPICAGRTVLVGFNDIATLFPEIAREADGWEASSFVAGSNKKLRWKCEEGHHWMAIVNDRTYGSRGCPTCAKAGFDPNKDGWLYFLSHPEWELFQIGITNNPNKRVGTHLKSGWEVLEIRGPMDGHLTQQWETAILRMLRLKGADLSNSSTAGKFDGYSEAWTKSTFKVASIMELMRLTEEFEVE